MTTDAIIGFLSGSLLTEVLRELVRIFTHKFDLRKDLRKHTYERKLQVAEKAMAYYYTFYERMIHAKKAYEMYAKLWDKTEPDTEFIEQIIEHNSEWLGELNDNKYIDINSVYLYFDLNHQDSFGETDTGRLSEARLEATLLKEEIDLWLSLYNDHFNDDEKSTMFYAKAKDVGGKLKEKLNEIILLMAKNQESYRKVVNLIKEQMQRY
ncbi:hypothetical protein [Niastella sp. OAS944]|uniref:hypothetical protein n=1 Tax=Niastella sp. OAS944 TaxID=2664089 RepID=UPI0034993F14|nr:hypothetical protein [Chitinophagaceae bacterium OAS944]